MGWVVNGTRMRIPVTWCRLSANATVAASYQTYS